jgi:glycosyltransferase involved in cell wall biosynthesis
MNFCFSARWNDHNAYPRSLVDHPPEGWKFRNVKVVFDEILGRPWCRFDHRRDEIIHASSLIPTNGTPWILDTDHIEYLFTQSEAEARQQNRHFVRAKVEETLMQYLNTPNCLGILAWSEAAKSSICELYQRMKCAPPRICVAYPGVVPPTKVHLSATDRVETALAALKPHTVKLLAIDGQIGVCDISGRKNICDVVSCFSRVREAGLPVELILIGVTERLPLVDDHIHFLPRLSRADLWEVYHRSDILMFLSRQDSFGYVLLEAMYNRVVSIATTGPSVPVTSEIIQPWETGILVNFSVSRKYPSLSEQIKMDELVEIVGRLISDRLLRNRIAETALREFERGGRFNIDDRNMRIVQAFFP